MLSIPLPVPMMPIRITRFERPDAIGPKAEIPVFGSAHSSPSPKTSFGSSMKKLENVGGACSINLSVRERLRPLPPDRLQLARHGSRARLWARDASGRKTPYGCV
jgi:hypothetical protein